MWDAGGGVARRSDVDLALALATERLLRPRLASARPRDAVHGEEGGLTGGGPRRWLLDPIDGTCHDAAGRPSWYVLVALLVGEDVMAGTAVAPALGRRRWASRGGGAYADGAPLRVSTTPTLAQATVHDDWSAAVARGEREHPAAVLAAAALNVRTGAEDGFLAVAEGRCDACLSVGGEVWDFAVARVLVEEAGGRFSALDGRLVMDARGVLVTNGRLQGVALAVIDAGRPG